MNSDKPEYGISRLELKARGTFGWQVRLQRNGVRFSRFFSDETWGGSQRAFEKARQFRDRLLSRLERNDDGRVRGHSLPAGRNQSGVVGVTRIVSVGANGVSYAFWQASWSPAGGPRRQVRFSVLRYGENDAFRLACEAREEALGRK